MRILREHPGIAADPKKLAEAKAAADAHFYNDCTRVDALARTGNDLMQSNRIELNKDQQRGYAAGAVRHIAGPHIAGTPRRCCSRRAWRGAYCIYSRSAMVAYCRSACACVRSRLFAAACRGLASAVRYGLGMFSVGAAENAAALKMRGAG